MPMDQRLAVCVTDYASGLLAGEHRKCGSSGDGHIRLMQWHHWLVSPLRRPTFVGAKVGKTPCPCIRPYAALRVPSFHPCSRGDRAEGPSWPCGARRPSMAVAPLRKGSIRPTEGTICGVCTIWVGRSTATATALRWCSDFDVDLALRTSSAQTPWIVPSVG